MGRSKTYKPIDIRNELDTLYALTKSPYHGGMSNKPYLLQEVASICKSRGILIFNNDTRNPIYTWAASMSPTDVLAKSIYDKFRELSRAKRKRKNINSEIQNRLLDEPMPAVAPGDKEEFHSEVFLPPDVVNKLGDKFLVAVLRNRGYTVTCTKTIEL